MSAELTKARQQLSQVRGNLRQGKILPAVQSVQFALQIVIRGQLLKDERREFDQLLTEAVSWLALDTEVRKLYPLQLEYAPGKERELAESMKDLLNALGELAAEEAQEHIRQREERKAALLARGSAEFAEGKREKGLQTFALLNREFPNDPALRGEMGKALLEAAEYEAAVEYLQSALDIDPELLPLYTWIAIALRKLDRFEAAEQYYLRAAERSRMDPSIYFNIGRLYIDWEKWEKAVKAGRAAIQLKPDFIEARKLVEYAEKKLAAQETK